MPELKRISIPYLYELKKKAEPISWLTCYDYPGAVLVDQAGRLGFGGKRRGGNYMADTTDDLGIPNKLVRPASKGPEPLTTTDRPRPAVEPASPLPPTPGFLRANAQPAGVPPSSRPRWNDVVTPMDSGVEARKLVVGHGVSLSGEIKSCDRLVVEGSV